MPKVTVYIRTDDYDRWKAVEKKTEFIHDALNGTVLNLKGRVIKELKTAPVYPKHASPAEKAYIKSTYIDRDQLP